MEDDESEPHEHHRENYNVVDNKDKASLISTLVDRRAKGKDQPKLTRRAATSSALEFDLEDETFKKTKEEICDEDKDHDHIESIRYVDEEEDL